jgi:glycosyltransferase involved in cell wall biosynthesis
VYLFSEALTHCKSIAFLYNVKILILHQYFKTPQTGGALRSYYLAKALIAKGISTVVITTHNGSAIKKEFVEGIEVHYLPIPYDNSFGFVKRISSFLKFVWSIVHEADEFRDANVCYAISTPLTIGLAAIWIKIRHKIPYYFEVGDLWPEAPIQMGVIKNPLLKAILYKLEKSIYKRSKAIVALSTAIKEDVQRKASGKEIHVIPNMADTDFYKPEAKRADLEEKFGVKNKFVVSYIGTIGLANGLEHFIDCVEASKNAMQPLHFLICGGGAELNKLRQLAQRKSLNNLSFIPAQNRDGVREVMNVTDAAFISFKPFPVLETGSPNKYFDALAAGKLIVINFGGWMKKEIEEFPCGIHVDPRDSKEFATKMQPFTMSKDSLNRFQINSRRLAEDKYSRKKLGEEFNTLFEK